MTTCPTAIIEAFNNVREHHPEVVRVVFFFEDEHCGGQWLYESADGSAPTFGPDVDVSLLEAALDAAYEHRSFPAIYSADEIAA